MWPGCKTPRTGAADEDDAAAKIDDDDDDEEDEPVCNTALSSAALKPLEAGADAPEEGWTEMALFFGLGRCFFTVEHEHSRLGCLQAPHLYGPRLTPRLEPSASLSGMLEGVEGRKVRPKKNERKACQEIFNVGFLRRKSAVPPLSIYRWKEFGENFSNMLAEK
jgi:hypothetical protein